MANKVLDKKKFRFYGADWTMNAWLQHISLERKLAKVF